MANIIKKKDVFAINQDYFFSRFVINLFTFLTEPRPRKKKCYKKKKKLHL